MTDAELTERDRHALVEIGRMLRQESSSVSVVLVEDDRTDEELSARVLADCGIEVKVAHSGEEAVRLISADRVFVVLLDLKLGGSGRSGLSVLSAIKSVPGNHKIIVLTGAYERDSLECKSALSLGALAIMLKPLTPEHIHLIFGTPT